MQPIKIDKRLAENTDAMRRRIQANKHLTDGEKHALLNRLNKIDRWGVKANAQLQRSHRRHADYDARTNEDIAAQMEAKKAVFAALMAGRRIDLTDAPEFKVSQMHTTICKIRQDIYRKALPVVLCDEWCRPDDGRKPYKRYWIEAKDINQ